MPVINNFPGVDLISDQIIDGQKDFSTYPRVWIPPTSEIVVPEGYTQLNYIRGEGASYTLLNYKANQNTEVELDCSIDTIANKWIFGSSDSNKFFALNILNNTQFESKMGNQGSWTSFAVSDYTPYTRGIIKVTNDGFYYNGVLKKSYSYHLTETASSKLAFCSRQTDPGSAYGYVTLYRLKIYESNILKCEYVPCLRDSDGTPGLYDIVGDEFVYSLTSTNFVPGPESAGHYETLLTDARFFTYLRQIDGYNPTVVQTLKHNANGYPVWVNN
jgi:hypothetical protein